VVALVVVSRLGVTVESWIVRALRAGRGIMKVGAQQVSEAATLAPP
jgi:hypothetical protein